MRYKKYIIIIFYHRVRREKTQRAQKGKISLCSLCKTLWLNYRQQLLKHRKLVPHPALLVQVVLLAYFVAKVFKYDDLFLRFDIIKYRE